MSAADAIAADAATTNWRTYDGAVPANLIFYAVLFPLLMAALLAVPALSCYFALSVGKRGRIVAYSPPNRFGEGLQRISNYHGALHHGSMAEKF
ncbi:hypothetical protein VPNG_09864 [Cytospora leucostoma]|uniref:Uncharacterized protein n=1 Tax=Cytospora leucostoma TaxID=1230097 RepID=A0A423VNM0_9PEZI|nr:hypothetical protein VPNG_09864 [Cytospora leucostoma]